MNKVADYDTYDYNYGTYWKKREYEHGAEELVLKKLLKDQTGDWFLDIGGSFGRVSSMYTKRYKHPVIVDYSLKTLQLNYITLKKKYPNIELIAANAYYLPFKENSFDCALMIRVLHHIEEQQKYFNEVYRILNGKGIYIQEFANKLHIKAVLRAILTLNTSLFNKKPYQQPDRQHYEGTRPGSKVLFYNYHTKWIVTHLEDSGLHTVKKYGCSFLRVNLLKKIFRTKQLLFWENIFQNTLSWTNISPSIFVKTKCMKDEEGESRRNIFDILLCPSCRGDLNIQGTKAVCTTCTREYLKKKHIWDFRV